MTMTMAVTDRRARPGRALAIVLRVAAVGIFALMAIIVQHLSASVPLGEVMLFRCAGMLTAMLLLTGGHGRLRAVFATTRLAEHLVRGGTGAIAIALNFAALSFLPVAEAQALFYLSPVIVIVIATAWLGERPGMAEWLGVMIGLAGALLMLRPDLIGEDAALPVVGVALGLAGAFAAALVSIQVRSLARTESSTTIVSYLAVVSTLASLCMLPLGWVWPTQEQLLLLGALALTGAIGQLLFSEALSRAEASLLAPFEYLGIVWAAVLGWLLFEQLPTSGSLISIAMIIGAALIISVYPRR